MEERQRYLARGVTRKDTFGDKRTFADGQSISIIEPPHAGAAQGLGGVFETCGRIRLVHLRPERTLWRSSANSSSLFFNFPALR